MRVQIYKIIGKQAMVLQDCTNNNSANTFNYERYKNTKGSSLRIN